MRLDEIIDTEYKTTDVPSEFDKQELRREKSKARLDPEREKRFGAYAQVDVDPDEPFTAKKKYHVPMKDVEKDAYYVYIKTVADQKLAQSNPYFPRVYDVDVERAPNGEVRPSFKMETLLPADGFDKETLYAMGDRMFDRFEFMLSTQNPSEYQIRYAISHGMTQILKYSSFERCKDPKLAEALKIIKKLVMDSEDFHVDIHTDNYMIRPTPHGPQLVLTDPVADMQTRG